MSKTILGLSGSLRTGSFNTALLQKIGELIGERADFKIADIGALPFYSEDLETPEPPQVVLDFKAAIGAADAVVIATPEYNYSIPGVLKNALDWASRPGFNSVLKDKRIGILSASMAGTAGVRAQGHLRTILSGTLSQVIAMPDVAVPAAHKIIEASGAVSDEVTIKHLAKLSEALLSE